MDKVKEILSSSIIIHFLIISTMQTFQWEEKQPTVPYWVHMIAGSIAGLSEHLSMLPLDNVKTHCQAGTHLPFRQLIKRIYEAGGLTNFYSGTSVLAMGCIPAHAIYFSIYQQAQKHLDCSGSQNHYKFAVVGMFSALFHDLVMTPTQVLKQRLQLTRSVDAWVHTKDLARHMYQSQGFISFYRSFGINFLMALPFNSCIVFFNEKLKYFFKVKPGDHHLTYYLCGGIAGALAAIPTTPFDVIKTKLNTQNCLNSFCSQKKICDILSKNTLHYSAANPAKPLDILGSKQLYSHEKQSLIKYRNIFDTTKTIFFEEGIRGFFNGMIFRMTIQSVSSGIAWGTYHMIKNLVTPEPRIQV